MSIGHCFLLFSGGVSLVVEPVVELVSICMHPELVVNRHLIIM